MTFFYWNENNWKFDPLLLPFSELRSNAQMEPLCSKSAKSNKRMMAHRYKRKEKKEKKSTEIKQKET